MLISHVTILLALLLESHHAPVDWAGKWFLTSVDANMILQSLHRLASALAVRTLELASAESAVEDEARVGSAAVSASTCLEWWWRSVVEVGRKSAH